MNMLIKSLVGLSLVGLVAVSVNFLGPILTPFFLGAFLAYLGDPWVDRFEAWGLGRALSATLVFALIAAVLLTALMLFLPLLALELSELLQGLPASFLWLQSTLGPLIKDWTGVNLQALDLKGLAQNFLGEWQQSSDIMGYLLGQLTQSGLAIFGSLRTLALTPVVAFYLMRDKGLLPPATSDPLNNPDFAMIDAQLTTESFGLMAPGRPQLALNLATLPIAVTASGEAAAIARFYVVMHAAAANLNNKEDLATQLLVIAALAAEQLPVSGYARDMYEFVLDAYTTNPDKNDWEKTRDAIYQRYQIRGEGGYRYSRPFDAGINFAASLISLFYGEGDFLRTVQIASLAGWDSDNPAKGAAVDGVIPAKPTRPRHRHTRQ